MSEPIEVHILGGKKGESIVVRLPGNIWGVVDNYTPNLKRPETNRTLIFLRNKGVTRLSFLCLTHPHEDHYRGLSHLLDEFRPDRVWIFGSTTHRVLSKKVAEVLRAGAESKYSNQRELEATDELVRIFDIIEREIKNKSRIPPIQVERLHLGLPLLEINSTPPVRVVSIGASGRQFVEYEGTLSDCFCSGGTFLADRLPNVNHNLISGGILIEYGQARVVLGGDIETSSWEETLKKFESKNLNSNVVKASHHGSVNGYCDGLWQILSPNRTAVAIITPYSSQGLPSPEGMAHISSNAHMTLTPSLSGAALATDWQTSAVDTDFEGLSTDALVTLRGLFPKSSPPSDRLEGICSFIVDPGGNVDYSLVGEAGVLSGI